jgi:putative chitinase
MITPEILQKLAPKTPKAKRDRFLPFLNEACPRYQINTKLRLAAFLATICFESDHFKTTTEYADGWAYDLSVNPRKAKELGNRLGGDGPRFKGRALIQLTGRANYGAFFDYVFNQVPSNIYHAHIQEPHFKIAPKHFLEYPEAIAQPFWAVEASCWYWQEHELNKLADEGSFDGVQGKVNRGNANKIAKDLARRRELYFKALAVIPNGFTFSPVAHEQSATESPKPPSDSQVLANKDTATGDFSSKPSRFDRTADWIKDKKDKLTSIGVDPSQISLPSKLAIGANYAKGGILILAAFLWDNWWLLVLATALVIAGGFLYSKSKDRADARVRD